MSARPHVVIPPKVRVTAAFVGVAAVGLCVWQLGRHVERNEGREAALRVEGAPLLEAPAPLDGTVAWRVVRWAGRWDAPPELIAGRQHASARGYGVVQRFVREDGAAVLVDRGWIAADDVAGVLAGLPPGPATVTGQLRPALGSAGSAPSAGHGTRIWAAKAWPAVQAATGTAAPVYLVAGEADGRPTGGALVDGFAPVPARDDTSLHYASQWLALAVLAAIAAIPRLATRARDFVGA